MSISNAKAIRKEYIKNEYHKMLDTLQVTVSLTSGNFIAQTYNDFRAFQDVWFGDWTQDSKQIKDYNDNVFTVTKSELESIIKAMSSAGYAKWAEKETKLSQIEAITVDATNGPYYTEDEAITAILSIEWS